MQSNKDLPASRDRPNARTIEVVRWAPKDEILAAETIFSVPGGWFASGMRWRDYEHALKSFYGVERFEILLPYLKALRESIREKVLRFSGSHHHNGPDGVPVFQDGRCLRLTWRAWGDLMAAVWSEEDDHDYCFLDFALFEGERAPPIPPGEPEEEFLTPQQARKLR